MSDARRSLVILALIGACLGLASCNYIPGLSPSTSTPSTPSVIGTSTKSATATGTKVATGTPSGKSGTTTTAVVPQQPPHTPFASSPTPSPADPLLASGSWGYRKRPAFEQSTEGTATHDELELKEQTKLTSEQSTQLLKIFRHSSKIHRLIEAQGGELSEAKYVVASISAWDDATVDTPWVNAALGVVFPTDDGVKVIACNVYRERTRKGLDMRPLVAATVVGYLSADGTTIQNPKSIRLK